MIAADTKIYKGNGETGRIGGGQYYQHTGQTKQESFDGRLRRQINVRRQMQSQTVSTPAPAVQYAGLLKWQDDLKKIEGIKDEIWERFHTPVHEMAYTPPHTDAFARSYDCAMLDASDISGSGNVIISSDILLKMSESPAFKEKVFSAIRDCADMKYKAGGIVKSTGAVIHGDGSAGYFIAFDWGDDDEKGRSRVKMASRPFYEALQEQAKQSQTADGQFYPQSVYWLGGTYHQSNRTDIRDVGKRKR